MSDSSLVCLILSVIAESSIENISTTRIAREVMFVVCVLVVHCACKLCQQWLFCVGCWVVVPDGVVLC